jgi:glycosyltransferase involved in cell wall biosynthesis
MQPEPGSPHVWILLCTYNGERFLAEQLESLRRQSHSNWSLAVSDDGSTDRTLERVEQFGKGIPGNRLMVISGQQRGFAANFLALTAQPDLKADFYAWADQDDIWPPDKLAIALDWLKAIPKHVPALFCARSELIDETGSHLGFSPLFQHPPHFSNALVQSIAGGNTMVFNQAARELIKEAGGNVKVPSHDWWAYLLISGAGGAVHYDPVPAVQYRQHAGNLVGSNASWTARLKRMRMVFQGRFNDWNTRHIRALEAVAHCLEPENKARLDDFKATRNPRLLSRLASARRAGLHRQTLLQNFGLFLVILFKKI